MDKLLYIWCEVKIVCAKARYISCVMLYWVLRVSLYREILEEEQCTEGRISCHYE